MSKKNKGAAYGDDVSLEDNSDDALLPNEPVTPQDDSSPTFGEALEAFGLRPQATVRERPPLTVDGHELELLRFARQVILQVDILRGNRDWRSLTQTQRLLLRGAQIILREMFAEPVPPGEFATLRDALGSQYPDKLTGALANQTRFASLRQTGKITGETLRQAMEKAGLA